MSFKRNTFIVLFISLIVLLGNEILWAKTKPAKIAKTAKPAAPVIQEINHGGAIRGGQSEQYLSLQDVRRTNEAKQNIERLVIDWGDRVFDRTDKGGYYQIEYREKPLQLILHFSLTLNTKFENQAFNQKVGNGILIKDAKLDFDPMTQSMLMTLRLRKKIKVRVSELNGSAAQKTTAKLVVDLIGLK